MTTFWTRATVVVLLAVATGCSGGSDKAATADKAESKPAADTAATPVAQAMALDAGPRASADMTLDTGRAARGAALFDTKGCADCHTFGEADLAPDLFTALDERTLPWLQKQITDPEWMLEHDPITKRLYEEYGLEMADMDVSATEADDILHHILEQKEAAAR